MEEIDIVIIGAGVIGLSCASMLANNKRNIIVIERHPSFGYEGSSRNSEVIHSGIYYKNGSLKARLCIEGKNLIYQFCERYNIPYNRIGKLIVACNDDEAKELERLLKNGQRNGVEDLRLLSKEEIKRMEPNIQAISALYSPSTGIVDTHQLMKCLEFLAKEKGAIFAYNCEVIGILKEENGYRIDVRDSDGSIFSFLANIVINSAGLSSGKIAKMLGFNYDLRYCKGEYFKVAGNKSKLIHHLIYPTPDNDGLGIHTVQDLQGGLKLGPNAFYVEDADYSVNESHRIEFYEKTKRFLPFIELDDLSCDMAGIRPKFADDFIIKEEIGFPKFINLIGIESPGLTACLSIGKYVKSLLKE
ncbi:TPA: NAD(P)/FAD-dependent oxidoreductase [bacterium]|nr:NAD(P)/FAD-dependent oxidoreductase [bacterium]